MQGGQFQMQERASALHDSRKGLGHPGEIMTTPMMRQYLKMKQEYPKEILLFRMGDFYESFYEDARIVSKTLGIALTAREKSKETGEGIPLAGFPHHALDSYLTKLLKAGHRVAICEQVEDPSKSRGLVRREVVEVVTPGTIVSGSALEERQSSLLASVSFAEGKGGLAFCDLSTGDISITEVGREEVGEELGRWRPTEVLLSEEENGLPTPSGSYVTELEPWKYDVDLARRKLEETMGLYTLEGLDLDGRDAGLSALGALLAYVSDTKKSTMGHLRVTGVYNRSDSLILDRRSARSLRVVETGALDDGESLADVTDRTVTAGGGREWRRWLLAPPVDADWITARYEAVSGLMDSEKLGEMRDWLSECTDLGRQAGKLGSRRSTPRDLRAIAGTAAVLPDLLDAAESLERGLLSKIGGEDRIQDIRELIESTLVEDPPPRLTDGDVVKPGVSEELDDLRDVRSGGKRWISDLVEQEREATGIPNLSVGFNKVFGYYIEVTRSHLEKIPEHYIRKQTLVGGERFVTPELKETESRMLRAGEEIDRLQAEIFDDLKERVARYMDRIKRVARALATLDVLCGLARLAREKGYVRPSLADPVVLSIREGMHPILADSLPSGECVPNDLMLDRSRRILLVTGPNMAGKSTYLRQAALLVILAQAGSFVPAFEMVFSPVDRIFTRIGSTDRITRGQSTFLVEMSEVAVLLNSCTERSLAILDEVGRGTSTFDGLSIAWAMLESLHDHQVHRPLVLFATHYHELTALGSKLPCAANVNVVVRERSGKVLFLYSVREGGTDRSYGIHVASMAGVPPDVLKRARRVLRDLEAGRHLKTGVTACENQLELPLDRPEHPVLEEIRQVDPDSLAPRKALELIYELREKLSED
ncbi:DNA mismatch repair protein MutS [Candidatus Fermentibacteria bacterium]|nr:DNA mismatch repair protein MutS [Candidatus Fermentibacteria bacterium]